MAKKYFMDWCPDLIVRTDIGHSAGDHKHIATASCKAAQEGRHCPRRGCCMEARDEKTGARVSSKTFGD